MKKIIFLFLEKNIQYIWLITIILISVILKLLILGQGISNRIELPSTLDFSWSTDIVERLLHGFVAGRDFIFTYGPLYQFIESIPSLVFKSPSYVSVLYAQIILIVITCILVFLMTKLITSEKKEQIMLLGYYFFIVDFNSFDGVSSLIRILIPLFYILIYKKFASLKNGFDLKKSFVFLLPAIFGMYIFDLFVICLLITISLVIYEIYAAYARKFKKISFNIKLLKNIHISRNKFLLFGFFQIGLIIFFEIVLSLLLSGNFNYLLYSLDTVKSYQFIMNIPLSFNKSYILFIYPLSLIFLLIYTLRRTKINPNLKNIFILLSFAALLELKSAIIRTDEGHIIMGVYPSIIVIFTIFYFVLREKKWLFVIFFLLFLLIPFRGSAYSTISYKYFKSAITLISQDKKFFDVYRLPEDYYFTDNDFKYFATLIKRNPQNVMMYPYDNYILNIYNQTYNTFSLQFYEWSGSIVETKTVENLSKSPPRFIILGVDKKSALNLDNIPNFSRNPLISKWMITNYSVYKNQKKYLILKYNPSKKFIQEVTKNFYDKDCSVYDIDVSGIIKSNLIDNLSKPSNYYLTNPINIHLPFTSNIKTFFIIEDYADADKLQELIDSDINFNKYYMGKKHNLEIVKKYQFPKIKKTFKNELSIKCY